MKLPILLSIQGLFVCSLTYAQVTPTLSGLPMTTIRLVSDAALTPQGLFSHFELIDQRPDTARIGLHTNKAASSFSRSRDRQLVLAQPAATEIAAWLNKQYARPGAPYTALIVLRTLWLSDANYGNEDKQKDPRKLNERTHIRLKAEVYAQKDGIYTPIFRFDTLQFTTKAVYSVKSPYSVWDKDLSAILGELADSASLLTAQRPSSSDRRLRLEDIHRFNESRFGLPINGDSSLVPGAYASFEEFRNNDPSIRHYEIRLENNKRLLYISEGANSSYYSHDAWGYCDGKNIFVMRDGILYPAWKEGKAFYISGSPDPAITPSTGFIGCTVDMDNGTLY
ncbi:hypothetical protein ACQ86N_08080 [Puia sp. P3]|uniref:hypothetical protein n=1 Tax=Puia sp. P3 TaxID=3423952 RepID=UPI003D674EC4